MPTLPLQIRERHANKTVAPPHAATEELHCAGENFFVGKTRFKLSPTPTLVLLE
jgi:hypothetical protein